MAGFLYTNNLNLVTLKGEEEGVDTMRSINKILLENILPAHVAEHYLLQTNPGKGQDNSVSQKAEPNTALQ